MGNWAAAVLADEEVERSKRQRQLEDEARRIIANARTSSRPGGSNISSMGNVRLGSGLSTPAASQDGGSSPTPQFGNMDFRQSAESMGIAPGGPYGGTEAAKEYMAYEQQKAAEIAAQEADAAAQEELELQRKGVSQYADLYEDTDPEFSNFLRMGVNTGILKDKKDIIDAIEKYIGSRRDTKATQKDYEHDEDMQYLKSEDASQLSEQEHRQQMQLEGVKGLGRGTKEDKRLIEIDKILRNDYVVKQRTQQLEYASNVMKLLDNPNPVANDAARTQIARLSGEVGVLTDRDVARFGGRQSLTAKLNRATKRAAVGELTEGDRGLLKEVATAFVESAKQGLNDRLMSLAEGQSEAFDVPFERIKPLINSYGVDGGGKRTPDSYESDEPSLIKSLADEVFGE